MFDLCDGCWVLFIVFIGVICDMCFVWEEVFGFVVGIIWFEMVEEVVLIVNDILYGFVVGIISGDMVKVWVIGCWLIVGVVFVNNYYCVFVGIFFGGIKYSGYGCEYLIEMFWEYGYFKLFWMFLGFILVLCWIGVMLV